MNLFDFYFRQIVTQTVMDWTFAQAQLADHDQSVDNVFVGIMDGLNVVENHLGPDLSVDIDNGVAYTQEGARVFEADVLTNLNCAVDEYNVSTAVVNPGNERWLTIFARFTRDLQDPAIDGNGLEVYTKQIEDCELIVHQGAEAPTGTASRPAVIDNAVLLADINLQFGQTTIQTALHIHDDRRHDWTRVVGTTLADFVHGNAKDAVENLYTTLDSWATIGSPFVFSEAWWNVQPVLGPTPPPANVSMALDAIVYDLARAFTPSGASRVGIEAFTGPGAYVSWPNTNIKVAMEAVGTDLDAHIGGAPPQHPATSITFAPYLWITAADVQSAIQEIADDLAAAAPGPSGSTLVGYETPEGGSLTVEQALDARPRKALDDVISGSWGFASVVFAPLIQGGWLPPRVSYGNDLPKAAWWNHSWGTPFAGDSTVDLGVASEFVDVCAFYSSINALTGAGSETVRPFVGALNGGASTPELRVVDPLDMSLVVTLPLSSASWGGHNPANAQARCCAATGNRLYFLISDGVHAGGDYLAEWDLASMSGGWSTDLGVGVLGTYPKNRLRVVNNGNNIVALYGGVGSGGAGMIECFNNSGVSQWRADGDAPANAFPAGGLCSNGTDVFFTCRVNAAAPYNYQLCSATIGGGADPGYANLPATCCTTTGGGAKGECHDCVYDGRKVWFVTGHDGAAGNAHVGWFDPSTDVFLKIAWSLSDGVTHRDSFACCFDGLNLWLHDFVQAGAAATSFARLVGFPVANVQSLPSANAEPPGNQYFIKDRAAAASHGILNKLYAGRMCSDGDSVFVIVDDNFNKRLLRRVPRAGHRG